MADNAFKKFLSLKPPTVFRENGSGGSGSTSMLLSTGQNHSQNANKPSSSSSAHSLIPAALSSGSSSSLLIKPTNQSPSAIQTNHLVFQDASASNSNDVYNNSNGYTSGGSATQLSQKSHDNVNNSTKSGHGDDLYEFVEQFQEAEEQKWSNLEQVCFWFRGASLFYFFSKKGLIYVN